MEAEATSGMKRNFYNANSQSQSSAIQLCSDLLQRAAASCCLPDGDDAVLQLAEWGCSHGGNSIAPVVMLCEALQQRVQAGMQENSGSSSRPLQVHVSHTDVTSNDWCALFKCARTYVQQLQGSCPELFVTFAGIGSSMYVRNHPSGSLHLGFCFSTLHWLSKKPVNCAHAIISASSRVLPQEHNLFRQQAVSDFRSFLTLRAQEFRPRGVLVVTYVGSHQEVTEEPGSSWSVRYHEWPQQVADQMVAEGLLQPHEPGLMCPPVYFLDKATQQQILADLSEMWETLHSETTTFTSPVSAAWKAGQLSIQELAQAQANFWKAIYAPCLEEGLRRSGRSDAAIAALLDDFWARFVAAVVKEPVVQEYPCTRLLLRRRGRGGGLGDVRC